MILHQRPNLEQKRIIFNGFRAHNLRSAHKVFKTHKVLTSCTEQCTQETENASTVLQHSVSDEIALKYDPHHKLTPKNKSISIFLFSSFGNKGTHSKVIHFLMYTHYHMQNLNICALACIAINLSYLLYDRSE